MNAVSVAIAAGAFLAYSLVSGRLQGTMITAPFVFVIVGWAMGAGGLGVSELSIEHGVVHAVAELTLILVLFADAARIDLGRVKRDHNLPVRMLTIALPVAVILGTIVAQWLFPFISLWEAALLAALLAPTDAALGQAVVSARAVPVRIRQAINVESGLNDGIVLPVVLFFAALASAADEPASAVSWVQFVLFQLTIGPLVGFALGFIGARALDAAAESGWASTSFQGIGILSLAVLTYLVAELLGGNGFIAAFIGGMVFGNCLRHECTFLFEFMETEGQLLMLITFFVFGATLLPEGMHGFQLSYLLYAVLSLTLIRMLPVALSLVGSGVRLPTRLFLGWFGPRGLASILFVLLVLEEVEVPNRDLLFAVTMITVALSTLLHGVTAAPLASLYGRMAARMGECVENEPAPELPLRSGVINHKND